MANTQLTEPQEEVTPQRAGGGGSLRLRNAVIFALVAGLWLALDVATKHFFEGAAAVGQVVAGPFLGLFRFTLVHNTGAAWGMFGNSTIALGVMSVLICAVIAVYLFAFSPRATKAQAVGLALVFAGGLGNALDRFAQGYVIDFIETTFIQFPVFNVADIGVTCGFVLFFAAMLIDMRRQDKEEARQGGRA